MFLVSGLQWPITTAIIAGIYLIGRLLYTYGYRLTGPKGRGYGFLIFGPIQFFLPIYAMVSLGYLAANGNREP